MLEVFKRRLPEPVIGAMRQVRARSRQLVLWPGRALSHELPSGVRVAIGSASDWAIYNEVFVDGEYDRAIRQVIASSVVDPYIVDLGANVGLFALRFSDMWLRERGETAFQILSVEGAPRTYEQLARNVRQPVLGGRCVPVFGLVGARDGHGTISTSVLSGLNSMYTRQSFARACVRFVDLEELIPSDRQIALMKCDIEGAEHTFLESYPKLLGRVNTLIIEFHHELCDVGRCRGLLKVAGLAHRYVLRTYPGGSVELFNRQPLEA